MKTIYLALMLPVAAITSISHAETALEKVAKAQAQTTGETPAQAEKRLKEAQAMGGSDHQQNKIINKVKIPAKTGVKVN